MNNVSLMEPKVVTPIAYGCSILLATISQSPTLIIVGGIVSVLAGINYCLDIANKWEARKKMKREQKNITNPNP